VSVRMRLPEGLVTFLFTDIEGSTRIAQMLGAEYRTLLTEHRRVLRAAWSAADGVELFTEGDSVFVAFPDAGAALVACATAQRELASHQWPHPHPPRVRMGLHTGYAQPYGGEYASAEVHRAARIAASAHGGQVLCSAATASHAGDLPHGTTLKDLGLHRLRGFDGRERLLQLVAPGLERDFPRPRGAEPAAHNLPVPTTTFVGRVAEQRELRDLTTRHRMVSVVGPAGAGKTRLAVEVAATTVARHPDGVWFIDLADLPESDVDKAVAETLGLRPEPGRELADTIAEHAASRRMLLVLDTCDAHPAVAAALVDRLLRLASGTNVLVTSREPLNLPGEVVWRIPPLAVRPAGPGRPSDAVALLLDRAAAARGGRAVLPTELADLARVAIAVDGLPLALELAAARLRVLSAAQLAARLHDVLAVLDAGRAVTEANLRAHLAADRHRTMEAAVEWSYRTLPAEAARLLRWLSVFAGPMDMPTVEAVLGADPLDPLAVLVDKSLLQAESAPDGSVYRVLDAIRAYAARRLREAGEEQAARDRHVAWCLAVARRAHLDPEGRAATVSLSALDPLADELRAALHWTVTGGSARDGLAVAAQLDQWWRERGHAAEGRRWLDRLYERITATGERIPDAELAAAYQMHAGHAGADGDRAAESTYLHRAEGVARRAGDPALVVRIRAAQAAPLLGLGRTADAERACREAIHRARHTGVPGEATDAVYHLAQLLWRRGDLDEAADLLAAARPREAARPAERGRRTVDMLLGLVALSRGDLVAAHDHLVVALRSRMSYGFHASACEALAAIAVRCALGGEPLLAARLFGAAQSARARLRVSTGFLGQYWAEHQTAVRGTLGDGDFDAAYAAGGALTLEEATALALSVEHPDLALHTGRFTEA
jgi:predicted ATPase/class 3 adenylate cyclase